MDDYKDYYMMVDLAFLLKKRVVARMIENEQTEYEKGYSAAVKDVICDIEEDLLPLMAHMFFGRQKIRTEWWIQATTEYQNRRT